MDGWVMQALICLQVPGCLTEARRCCAEWVLQNLCHLAARLRSDESTGCLWDWFARVMLQEWHPMCEFWLQMQLSPDAGWIGCPACLQTIENTREADVTMVAPGDEEVALDEADDEFAGRRTHIEAQHSTLHTSQHSHSYLTAFRCSHRGDRDLPGWRCAHHVTLTATTLHGTIKLHHTPHHNEFGNFTTLHV